MIVLHQDEYQTMRYTGAIEGFRILAHIVANEPSEAALSGKVAYKNIIVDWKCNEQQVYSGDLLSLVQFLFFRAFDSTLRMQFLNKKLSQIIRKGSASQVEEGLTDLSVSFPSYAGEHVVTIRMNKAFANTFDKNTFLQFDWDKSDEICLEKFIIRTEPVNISGDKSLNILGDVSTILWVQSDNEFVEDYDNKFNNKSVHPVQNSTITSRYSENNYTGEELAIQDMYNLNGVATPSGNLPLQKSVRLSDKEIMENPNVTLKLNTASMSNDVNYGIMYDIVTLL